MTAEERTSRRLEIGVVESDVRDKTVTVRLDRLVKWAKYGKHVKRRSRVQVHDPANTAKTGDRVEIAECRPISKTKRWRLVRVVSAFGGGAAS